MHSTPLRALAAAAVTSLAVLVFPSVAAAEITPIVPNGTVIPLGTVAAVLKGTEIRFATFNVRTSRADIGTSRHWLHRAVSVANEIKSHDPGIVAIQELGPGRADGKKIGIKNSLRQTESLEKALRSVGAGKYQLVRTTAYVPPGTSHATQGTRILYNTNKYRLISNCPETTGKKNYNRSCSMDLPVLSSDGKSHRRSAAYAEFEDRSSGKNFFVISVHLDDRHSPNLSQEQALDSLRAAQVRAVYNKVNSLAGSKPILFGGDINSWRSKRGSHAPFDVLQSNGFRDATAAPYVIDAEYPTVNHWHGTLNANAEASQVALDVVMGKGVLNFDTYENVMDVSDPYRPSDHNMVITNLVI
jgi:endonuclease/exonuclease/phosphatase family metal-dependent hydrolase